MAEKMIIGVKIGSSLLTDENGVNREYLLSVCSQLAQLRRGGDDIFLVTSGAVASEPNKKYSKNLRAAIGQAELIGRYRKFLNIFGIKTAQVLVNDKDIIGGSHIAREVIMEAMSRGVIPIINANDVVGNRELNALEVCADNDRLAQALCLAIGVNKLIIGIDERGLKDDGNELINVVFQDCPLSTLLSFVKEKSKKGHGEGMKTKVTVAYELARSGMPTILAPGRSKDFILRVCKGEANFGTIFVPAIESQNVKFKE